MAHFASDSGNDKAGESKHYRAIGRTMHPSAARSNRSTLQSTVLSTATKILQHQQQQPQQQQQQQQILYGPITTPVVTLHPCTTGPPCVYPGAQRSATPASPPLQMQGKNKWQSKNKHPRLQQQAQQPFCPQPQHPQQQVAYNSKPVLLFDQAQANVPPPQPPSASSFVLASSSFTHGPYPNEHYSPPGVALIPQPYFKSPDLPAFCLLKDRQTTQQPPVHGSYYNISTSSCSLQTINANSAFQLPNLGPYAAVAATFANNQISGPVQSMQSVQSAQIFPTPPIGLVFGSASRDKTLLDVPVVKPNRSAPTACKVTGNNSHDWQATSSNLLDRPSERLAEATEIADSYQTADSSAKTQEEHYSDESSTSFDFTIEAEKMVSALCNTTSLNDLAKDDSRNCKMDSSSFNGAGDNVTNKTGWFADFCSDYENVKSVGVQTDGPCTDRSQYAELIRKTAYWGCTQAEIILNSRLRKDSRRDWLAGLSSATRTAITKSSTCFPVFAGDRILANDLINALLRVSNGWLILDNYLNKEHYPSLSGKFDRDLVRCFQMWEESTCELLRQIAQTFLKLEKKGENSNAEQRSNETSGTSFPGDVSLYTSHDLFDSLSHLNTFRGQSNFNEHEYRDMQRCSTQNSDLMDFRSFSESEQRSCPKSEGTKLRSKWTITENQSPLDRSLKSASDVFLGNSESSLYSLNGNSKFRARVNSTSKIEPSKQSLNAEFYHLRNKVLESNSGSILRQWTMKNQKTDVFPDKASTTRTIEPIFKLQRSSTANDFSQQSSARTDSLGHCFDSSSYLASNQSVPSADANYMSYSPYSAPEYGKSSKNPGYSNLASADPVYVGKSSSDQLPAVPRNKMTLLSQIEPSTPDKDSEGMAANLSAWFASMRNVGHRRQSTSNLENKTGNDSVTRSSHQDSARKAMDFSRQLQLDANRQLQTLQNMRSIQSAPWTACNPIGNRNQSQHAEEYDSSEDVRVYMKPGSYNVPKKRHQRRPNRRLENSHNSHNSRNASNSLSTGRNSAYNKEKDGRATSSASAGRATSFCNAVGSLTESAKVPFPAPSAFSLDNSPRILKRADSLTDIRRDITWKAACASAEILLEALNVKECGVQSESAKILTDVMQDKDEKDKDKSQFARSSGERQVNLETMKRGNEDNCADASSYEASEDDSGSTCKFSPSVSVIEISQASDHRSALNKNVKTDSWLIRTLNNANIVPNSKRQKGPDVDADSSESSNVSLIDSEQPIRLTPLTNITPMTLSMPQNFEGLERTHVSQNTPDSEEGRMPQNDEVFKKMESTVSKATYSETVRRSTTICTPHPSKKDPSKRGKSMGTGMSAVRSAMVPLGGRRGQRKETERSYSFALLHKSRKSSTNGKKLKNSDLADQFDDGGCCTKLRKWRSGESCKDSAADGVPKLSLSKFCKKKEAGFLDGKCPGKSGDRGWSVWYSSKKRQTLSPLTLSKLETIHQVMWQMEDANIFKCPAGSINDDCRSDAECSIEDYYKAVRNPMFLETIGYKLKNRIYHKVEHAVKDFRRIVYNSRLYYKNDNDRVMKVENLSRKFEDLLEEYFANWDFENVSGSPRESSPMSQRSKQTGQKPAISRYNNARKSPPIPNVTENTLSH